MTPEQEAEAVEEVSRLVKGGDKRCGLRLLAEISITKGFVTNVEIEAHECGGEPKCPPVIVKNGGRVLRLSSAEAEWFQLFGLRVQLPVTNPDPKKAIEIPIEAISGSERPKMADALTKMSIWLESKSERAAKKVFRRRDIATASSKQRKAIENEIANEAKTLAVKVRQFAEQLK